MSRESRKQRFGDGISLDRRSYTVTSLDGVKDYRLMISELIIYASKVHLNFFSARSIDSDLKPQI